MRMRPFAVLFNWHDEFKQWLPRRQASTGLSMDKVRHKCRRCEGAHVPLGHAPGLQTHIPIAALLRPCPAPQVMLYDGSKKKQLETLERWRDTPGAVIITTHTMYTDAVRPPTAAAAGAQDSGTPAEAAAAGLQRDRQRQAARLLTRTPELVVVDEGHVIKNPKVGT